MAKKQGNSPVVVATPKAGEFAVSLEKLAIEQAQNKIRLAQETVKIFDGISKIDALKKKLEADQEDDISVLSADFSLKKVEMEKEISDIETRTQKANDDFEANELRLKADQTKLEADHRDALGNLFAKNTKTLDDADYKFEKDIRDRGEKAFKQFLSDRGLETMDAVELKDLKTYEAVSGVALQEVINKAVATALDKDNAKIEHEAQILELENKGIVDLLNKEISNHNALVGKLEGMLNSTRKRDESFMSDLRDIIKETAHGISNTIVQDVKK